MREAGLLSEPEQVGRDGCEQRLEVLEGLIADLADIGRAEEVEDIFFGLG